MVPTVASGRSSSVVIVRGPWPCITVRVNVFSAVSVPLLALTVKLKVPCAVGVPLMTPQLERDNPSGNEPETMDQVTFLPSDSNQTL